MRIYESIFLLFLLFSSFTYLNAIEPKNGEDDNVVLSPVEKKVKDIFEKIKEKDYDEDKLIDQLTTLGEQVIPVLLREIYNKDTKIIVIAACALHKISGEKALPEIIKAYGKQASYFDMYKLSSLIEGYDDKALPYLKRELNTENAEIRYELILTIGYINTKKSVELLSGWFKDEKSEINKLHIIHLIFEKDKENQKEYLRFAYKMLDNENIKTKCKAIKTLGDVKDTSKLESLIKWAGNENINVRSAAFNALCKIGTKDAVEVVIGNLTNDNVQIRCLAASNLVFVETTNVELETIIVNSLIKTLGDKDKIVRLSAIRCLSWFKDLDIVPHLEKIAEDDSYEFNRDQAKKAIERIRKNKKRFDKLSDENAEKSDKDE